MLKNAKFYYGRPLVAPTFLGGVNLKIKNFIGHLKTITYHKIVVFKLCVKAGILYRGLVHDLSKYSPTEFWEGVKYYQEGKRSPISYCREVTRLF